MTSPDEPTLPQPEPAPDPDPPPEAPAPRRLTRSSTDRWIGGVAGGLGRHLGIDPIIVRIGFVLLTFISGLGLLIYLALLAFVPSDDGKALGGGNRAVTVAAAAGLVVLALIFLGPPAVLLGPGLLVLALVAVVVMLALRAIGDTGDPVKTAARVGLICLGALAAFGAALGVGFVAAVGGGVAIGILTVVTGLALVATAFLGGARWLVVPGLVLALPLAVVAAGDIDIEGGLGTREYRPASLAEVQPGYRLGVGELDVDLRGVALPPGRTDLTVDLGIGHARVNVADDVCVTSDVQIGAGAAYMFDHVNDGVDVAFAEGGAPKPGQPVLHVDANLGVGQLEVDRSGTTSQFTSSGAVACP
jgi:phage shock protein PspC (stress-responsive transcriptional regulator)